MSETWAETLKAVIRRPMEMDEIYAEVRRRRKLTPHLLEAWPGNKQLRYQHWCRSELAKMVKRGEIQHTGRGQYAPS
ncbi:MAG: hypothetical protein GEU87_05355 [Alphaproteobacteria bacterium]|nr:hypothetical protein [Alphaproteobacteria bacterium]